MVYFPCLQSRDLTASPRQRTKNALNVFCLCNKTAAIVCSASGRQSISGDICMFMSDTQRNIFPHWKNTIILFFFLPRIYS